MRTELTCKFIKLKLCKNVVHIVNVYDTSIPMDGNLVDIGIVHLYIFLLISVNPGLAILRYLLNVLVVS